MSFKFRRIILLVCFVAPLWSQTDYYVATTGNDITGTGAKESPWKTIQKAIKSFSLNTGAVIHVAEGNYSDSVDARTLSPACAFVGPFVPFCANRGGSSTARLVIQCDTPVGKYGCKFTAVASAGPAVSGASYIDISGFEFGPNPSAAPGFSVIGPPDVVGSGIDVHLYNLYVHDIGQASGSGCPQAGAIMSSHEVTGLWVIGSVVNHFGSTFATDPHGILSCSTAQGFYVSGMGTVLQSNIVSNVLSAGIVIANPCGNAVTNNLVFGARQTGIYEDQGAGAICTRTGRNTVANNITVNNGAAHDVGTGYGIKQANGVVPHDPTEFSNNILSGNWPNDSIGNIVGDIVSGNISESPTITFVNFQLDGSGDYHPQASSKAVRGGTSQCVAGGIVPCVPFKDLFGNAQTSPVTIGPLVSVPAPPSGLTVTVH